MRTRLLSRLTLFAVSGALLLGVAACSTQPAAPAPSASQQPAAAAQQPSAPAAPQQPAQPAAAADPAEAIFAGQNIALMVGYNPGGGVDLAARLVAQFLPNFLPGKPNVVVKNVPGGGGIAAANVLYNESKADGLTIAMPGRGNWLNAALLGDPAVKYKLTDFEWLGATGRDDILLAVLAKTGVKQVEDLKATPQPLVFGAWNKTTAPYVYAEIIRQDLDLNIKPVSGYDGSGSVLLAMQRGEVQGYWVPYSSLMASNKAQVDTGEWLVIARDGSGQPQIGNEVQIVDYLTRESVQVLRLNDPPVGISAVAPPNTNPVAVKALREGLAKLMADAAFLAEAEKRDVLIRPFTAEETRAVVEEMARATPETLARYKQIVEQ